jgi:hypothetical protein
MSLCKLTIEWNRFIGKNVQKSSLNFFKKKENIEKLIPFIKDHKHLRDIEYFCLDYSRIHCIDIYSSYKDQLRDLSRKKFDCFGKTNFTSLVYNNQILYTSIAQLNFFYWFFTFNIIRDFEFFYIQILNKNG